MRTDTPPSFMRFIGVTAVIVAASGVLGATGQPLYAAVGDATLQWAAVKSEREKLRRRVTGVSIAAAHHCAERSDSAQAEAIWKRQYRNAAIRIQSHRTDQLPGGTRDG